MADLQAVLDRAVVARTAEEAKVLWRDLVLLTRWMTVPGGTDDAALLRQWCDGMARGAKVLQRLMGLWCGGATAEFLVRVVACNVAALDALVLQFALCVSAVALRAMAPADLRSALRCLGLAAVLGPDYVRAMEPGLADKLVALLDRAAAAMLSPEGLQAVDTVGVILEEVAKSARAPADFVDALTRFKTAASAQTPKRGPGGTRRLQAVAATLDDAIRASNATTWRGRNVAPRAPASAGGRHRVLWSARWRAAKLLGGGSR
jgi:hypothetical protein